LQGLALPAFVKFYEKERLFDKWTLFLKNKGMSQENTTSEISSTNGKPPLTTKKPEQKGILSRIRNLFPRDALQEIAKTVPSALEGDWLGRAKPAYEQEADRWEQSHKLSKQSQREKDALEKARQKAVAENFKKIEEMAEQGKHLRTGADGDAAMKLVRDIFGDTKTAREWAQNILNSYYKKDSEGKIVIGPGGLPDLADGKKPDTAYWLATHIKAILGPEEKSSPPETSSSSGEAKAETPTEAPQPEASTGQSPPAPPTEAPAVAPLEQSGGGEAEPKPAQEDTAPVEAAGDKPNEAKEEESNPIQEFIDKEKKLLDNLIEKLGDDPQKILEQLDKSGLSLDEKQELIRRIQTRINDRLNSSEEEKKGVQKEERKDKSQQTESTLEQSIKDLIGQQDKLSDEQKQELLQMLEERKKQYETFKNHPRWNKLELAFFAVEIAIMILEMAKEETSAAH
jgi:hypothetical protein